MKKKVFSFIIMLVVILSMSVGLTTGIFANEIEPVEIISKRSEYEKHFDNGNGTTTAFIYTAPLHYYENGEWKEIDNSLVLDESGNYVNKSNSMKVKFSPDASVKSINSSQNNTINIDKNGYSISWDMVDLNSNSSLSNSHSKIKIKDDDKAHSIKLGNKNLNKKAEALVDNLDSTISYNSIYNNVDIDIDVEPSSVKETIIINSPDSVQEQFTYFIKADNLKASLLEDGSISFYPSNGETVFSIPPAFMFDSSDNAENNYDIETSIKKYKNGYLLTLIPDSDWINDENRVYPIMIDPTVSSGGDPIKHSTYVYEGAPNNTYANSYLKIGGSKSNGTRNEAFIFPQQMYLGLDNTTEILDVECSIDILVVSNNTYAPDVYVELLTDPTSTLSWNGTRDVNSENCAEFKISDKNPVGEYSIDVTNLFQTWFNYYKTNGLVGAPFYGFKLVQKTYESETILAYSSRVASHAPYYSMTYRTNQSYVLDYAPAKYNNIGSIKNFQNRMNCYAYALQVYCNDPNNQYIYKLSPGEIGIGSSKSEFSTNNELTDKYKYYKESIQECVKNICMNYIPAKNPYDIINEIETNTNFIEKMTCYSDFVQEQMICDADKMNFTINKINTNDEFNIPVNFNESNERIIAMVTYYIPDIANNDGIYFGTLDYHFYLRNGNGTCPNGHGGTCSMWSHKLGTGNVTNYISNSKLCDMNINNKAKKNFSNKNDVRYYRITKDTNVYNSWHGNKLDTNGTGTPYRP